VHKAVSVGTAVHIIEELQVFPAGQPVRNLQLDADRVSREGVQRGVWAVGLGCPALLPQSGGKIQAPTGAVGMWGEGQVLEKRLPGGGFVGHWSRV